MHAHDHLGLGHDSDESEHDGGEPVEVNDAEQVDQVEQVLEPAGDDGGGAGGFMGIGTRSANEHIIDYLRSQMHFHFSNKINSFKTLNYTLC